jgi:hypothetical protein
VEPERAGQRVSAGRRGGVYCGYGGDPRGEGEQLAIAGDEGGAQVRGECHEVALDDLGQDESPERASSLRSRMTVQRAANAGETCAART